jgi:hypothetical protein
VVGCVGCLKHIRTRGLGDGHLAVGEEVAHRMSRKDREGGVRAGCGFVVVASMVRLIQSPRKSMLFVAEVGFLRRVSMTLTWPHSCGD